MLLFGYIVMRRPGFQDMIWRYRNPSRNPKLVSQTDYPEEDYSSDDGSIDDVVREKIENIKQQQLYVPVAAHPEPRLASPVFAASDLSPNRFRQIFDDPHLESEVDQKREEIRLQRLTREKSPSLKTLRGSPDSIPAVESVPSVMSVAGMSPESSPDFMDYRIFPQSPRAKHELSDKLRRDSIIIKNEMERERLQPFKPRANDGTDLEVIDEKIGFPCNFNSVKFD